MAEKKKSNPEQSYRRALRARQLQDRLTEQDVKTAGGALGAGASAAAPEDYLSRPEFQRGFYNQLSQPAIDAETMYGKGTKRGFEYPTVDPDTKMMQDAQGMADGGSVRGQKNIQVKKKQFKGIF